VTAVATRPAPVELEPRPERPRGPLTLEERLELVLAGVRRDGAAQCPVCAAQMTSSAAGASCGGCGASLS
jgi:hypothetical protein